MLLVSQRIEAPRMEPYMPLQGSIKRKLEEDSSPVSSSINDIIFSNDNKRLCLDDVTLPMGQTQSTSSSVSCPDLQRTPFSTNHNSSSMAVSGHQVLITENNQMNGRGMPSPFSVTQSTDMGPKLPYEEKNTNLQSVDQELQDLLEELTKMPDPSPNDLDLEKILGAKSDEPLVISHSQPALSTTPKISPPQSSHMDSIPNKDFSGGCNSASAGSPQIRPSSTGTNYPITSSNKSVQSPIPTPQNKSQSQSMIPSSMANMAGGNWHAQQLKQLAASKQGSTGKQQVPTNNWPTISPTGLSPPYRPGSSPQQPFSPQNVMVPSMNTSNLPGNAIQNSQNALLSGISATSNPTSRPSPPYGSEKIASPALNQQPFSPQNSMLQNIASSNIPGGTIKSPQNNMVSSMVPANAGPSPPYQPEKLSSPALHQQPFSPQNSLMSNLTPTGTQSSLQNTLFKSMATNQSKNMNIIMQQPSNGLQTGIVNDNPVDQFSFNNTKPLSHFAPDSTGQKMNLSPSPGSLIHYLQQQQQQQQQHQSPAVQQVQQVGNSQFLQQQIRQLMQPSRMQRQMQSSGLPGQPRQDPNAGIVPRMQEPGSIPSAGSGPTPLTANGYIRNAILKEQIMRRQQQVKPRPNMMAMTSEQRNAFVAQQMNQFQSLPQTLRTDCVQPMPTPPQSHRIMTSTQGLIQTSLGSGMTPTTMNQNSGTMVMIPHNTGKQPGMFPGSPEFNMSLRQNQNALSMNSGCQTVHSQSTIRPGMTLSGYTSSSLLNHSAAQQHLRQSNISRIPNVYTNPTSQMWTQSGVSRITGQNQMDPSMQQFPTNPLFTKQNIKPNMVSQQFPHQGVVPPNQIAPGVQVRQMQKLGLSQANQGIGSLNNPNLGNNLARGQLSAINVMKTMPQGVSSFNQMNTAQLGPPSYGPASVQTPEAFDRVSSGPELHQYDFVTPQNNSVLSASCNEADFIDCLMKGGTTSSTDEEWLNNLTILDDILGQHSQNPGPV